MQKDCVIAASAHHTLRMPDSGGVPRLSISPQLSPSGQLFGRTLPAIARLSSDGRFSFHQLGAPRLRAPNLMS